MTGQRDIRADAARALARRLAHEPGLRNVELLASELLVILDGQQLGLVDRRRPENPDTVIRPPGTGVPVTADTDGVAEYLAAKANRPTEPKDTPWPN